MKRLVPVLVFVMMWPSEKVNGDIIKVTGDVLEKNTSEITSVRNGQLTGPNGKVFQERNDFLNLTSGIQMDVLTENLTTLSGQGDYLINSVADVLDANGELATGEKYDIYFLHFDSTDNGERVNYQGTVEFRHKIVGIGALQNRAGRNTLADTDDTLGNEDIEYPIIDDFDRDFDLRNQNGSFENGADSFDNFRISEDLKVLTFDVRNFGKLDQLRIVVSAVPEPTGGAAVVAGLLVVAAAWRRRRANGKQSITKKADE